MKKLIKRIILVTLAAIVVIGAILGVTLSRSDKSVTSAVIRSEQSSDDDTDVPETVNILLMGLDSEAGLCDVIMLVGIDRARGRTTVAHIPRDTYAAYSDADYKKLNGAYSSLGGAEQTAAFLGDAFDIKIQHYACISLDTFADAVDAIGGVDVNVPQDMRYKDTEQGLYIDLKKGVTHLDGKTAQHFVRFRSGYSDGDLGRIDAQKLFLAAVFDKLSGGISPAEAVKLASVLDGVETNIGISELLALSAAVLDMDTRNVSMLTLPGKEATATQSGASYYVISRDATAELAKDFFGGGGHFDGQGVFLNKRYSHFEQIYTENTEYSVTPVEDIIRNAMG